MPKKKDPLFKVGKREPLKDAPTFIVRNKETGMKEYEATPCDHALNFKFYNEQAVVEEQVVLYTDLVKARKVDLAPKPKPKKKKAASKKK